MKLGPKSTEKLIEILHTGAFRRVSELEKDERHQVR